MSKEGEHRWQREVERLHLRLERLQFQQTEAIQAIRGELTALVARMGGAPEEELVAPPPPRPPPLPEQPVLQEAEAAEEQEPAKAVPEQPFELQFGRLWLVRFGIVLLLTGLVLLGNFAYQNWIREMPNGVRLAGLFACAGVLIELGRRLAAKAALKKFGEVILAGGLAFFYYCTFAAHHVARLRVIESPVLASVLLLGAAGLIAGVSWVRNAKTTAVLGLLLASYSTMLQPIGWLSSVSNLLLAGASLFLMRRPGWAGPGVAAMAGTYSAFFGWQFLGAARGDLQDPAVLWFLPSVWALFSLTGLLGKFRETMSDRARAWFVGGNNVAFFLLFSGLWVDRFGRGDLWVLCAIFGLVLLGHGVVGRRKNQMAGGVNLVHGLALVSLSLVLKLDGFQLALALAVESLLLAAAFAKFRGRSELVFSCLAAAGAAAMLIIAGLPGAFLILKLPLWSAGVAALLIAAASVLLRIGAGRTEMPPARACAALVFFLAVAAAIWGWSLRLPAPWPLPVLAFIAAGLAAATLLADRKRLMPEVTYGSLIFLALAFYAGFLTVEVWATLAAGAFSLAAAFFWHRAEREGDLESDLKSQPGISAWAFSVATVVAAWAGAFHAGPAPLWNVVALAGLGLLNFAWLCRCERLAPCAALLAFSALYPAVGHSSGLPSLALALIALGGLITADRLPPWHRAVTAVVLRATAFLAICHFWWRLSPQYSGDGIALVASALTGFSLIRKKPLAMEAWGFLAISSLWLLGQSLAGPWSPAEGNTWRGGGVVLALLFLVAGYSRYGSETARALTAVPVAALACAATALWATQMLVWRHDWDAVSVLWTLLGFAAVCAGLWQRLRVMRQVGFLLLGMALIKIFAVDIWDFTAFTRVVSFIVLGAALILLGLFYNKFATVLKRLLEEENGAAGS